MSAAQLTRTRRGFKAWIARRWEFINVSVTLHYAERERDFLAAQLSLLPHRLDQLDADIGALRVRQIAARG